MYDDIEYLTNLNKKLRAEVDHKKNIVRHLQYKLSPVRRFVKPGGLSFRREDCYEACILFLYMLL